MHERARYIEPQTAYDMAQLRTIQESGLTWGFGSDGSRANQIHPFTPLWWAVTGKLVGPEGQPVAEAQMLTRLSTSAHLSALGAASKNRHSRYRGRATHS